MCEPASSHQQRYRLTATRANGSRETIGDGLTLDEASEKFMDLMDSPEFVACNVERVSGSGD